MTRNGAREVISLADELAGGTVAALALLLACTPRLDASSVPAAGSVTNVASTATGSAVSIADVAKPLPTSGPRPLVRKIGDDFFQVEVEQGVLEQSPTDPHEYWVRLPFGLLSLALIPHASDRARITLEGRPMTNDQPWTLRLRPGANRSEFLVSEGAKTERYHVVAWNGWTTTYIKSTPVVAARRFGATVALSNDGTVLAVGAPSESDEACESSGAAYVFRKRRGRWEQEARLAHAEKVEQDDFGESLSLSADGKKLAAGTPHPLEGDEMNNTHYWARPSGDANIFDWNDRGWQQVAGFHPKDESDSSRYGHVTISGDGSTLAVGAPENSDPEYAGHHFTGAVYVYELQDGKWTSPVIIQASSPGVQDHFGSTLSLSFDGSLLAIGAPLEDGGPAGAGAERADDSLEDAGAVFMFARGRHGWTQEAYLKPPGVRPHFLFGYAVAISADGSTLAVVSPSEGEYDTDGPGPPKYGPNHVFGAVYLFRRVGHSWLFDACLQPPQTEPYAHLGQGLALSRDGNVLAVGGSADILHKPLTSGSVHVFHRSAGKWSFGTTLKASAPEPFDWFGSALAISADGTSIAVGAEREDGGSSGIGGDPSDKSKPDSGAVYVFESLVGSPSTNRTPQSAAP